MNGGLTSSRRPARGAATRGGFTLLEILIATGILMIGLVSILALFPVAINVGRHVIETSNSVVIAQSIAEAIRDGVHNRKRYIVRDGVTTHVYFVFRHDGVKDSVAAQRAKESFRHDYFILLPRYRRDRKFSRGSDDADRRFDAMKEGKTFVYPETDDPPNGRGDALKADDDSDDDGDDDFWTLRVEKTYKLGEELISEGTIGLEDMKTEVLRQYSYAFAITPSYFDANLSNARREYRPANQLYHVRVMIFRGFVAPTAHTIPDTPVYELDFEISL